MEEFIEQSQEDCLVCNDENGSENKNASKTNICINGSYQKTMEKMLVEM